MPVLFDAGASGLPLLFITSHPSGENCASLVNPRNSLRQQFVEQHKSRTVRPTDGSTHVFA
ncbi:MAG: hypothetical protein WCD76_17760 [Pyrinomonadaceae bacterium]